MYDHEIKDAYSGYLAKDMDVPQNTTTVGTVENAAGTATATSIDIGTGAQQGAIEVVAVVGDEATDLTDTKAITIKIRDSADDSTFADHFTLYTLTAAAGSGVIAAGTELARRILPQDTRRYILASITTDDADVEGELHVYLNYLAR